MNLLFERTFIYGDLERGPKDLVFKLNDIYLYGNQS